MKRIPEHYITSLTDTLTNEDNFVFLESTKFSESDQKSMLFTNPHDWLICTSEDEVTSFFQECENCRKKGKYLAGWIAYEFGYLLEPSLTHFLGPGFRDISSDTPLAVLGLFDQPIVFDHSTHLFSAPPPWTIAATETDKEHSVSNIKTNIEREEYLTAIYKIKEYISAGHTYQVNFTMKLKFDFQGSLANLYRTLRRNQSVSFGAWIRHNGQDIISLSPELFYRADNQNITVRPMKGTMGRGRTTREDGTNRDNLKNDPKNRSENIMIVDLLRNDLGRLLHEIDGGQIRPKSLFDIETYETLLQMTSTIEGKLESGKQPGLQEVIGAIFPCGSITGAPKIRTMEIIHELEKEARGVYCGGIGYSGPDETVFNVPIRTVVIQDGQGEMGIGSGIIHDSDPVSEWQESLLKGNFLTRPTPEFQLIETLLYLPESGYWLLKEHLQRLGDSASYFLFSHDIDEICEQLDQIAKSLATCHRVRLLLHRDSKVEISVTELVEGQHLGSLQPRVLNPMPVVAFSRQKTNPQSRYLFHKTTSREIYNEARELALDRDLFEILFTNTADEVTEGSITNIFIEKAGQLITPPIQSGLLAGTLRQHLLGLGRLKEETMNKQDILEAGRVFVGNSVIGLVQVTVQEEEL